MSLVSCHEILRLLMKSIHGNCGHIRVRWDNHYYCLSWSSCSRSSTCSACNQWSQSVWLLAKKRRLHAMRKSVMTNRRHHKKRKQNASDPSDSISLDRALPHMALLPEAGPIKVASQWYWKLPVFKPTSHRSPVTDQPVTGQQGSSHPVTGQYFTGHPVTGQPVTSQFNGHPVTEQPVTSQPVTSQPVTSQPVISQPGTRQPVTGQMLPGSSHWILTTRYRVPVTRHRAFNHQSSITGHPVTDH